jgi:thiol-disulfide isomerase/thioredoxin
MGIPYLIYIHNLITLSSQYQHQHHIMVCANPNCPYCHSDPPIVSENANNFRGKIFEEFPIKIFYEFSGLIFLIIYYFD